MRSMVPSTRTFMDLGTRKYMFLENQGHLTCLTCKDPQNRASIFRNSQISGTWTSGHSLISTRAATEEDDEEWDVACLTIEH